MYKSVPRVTFDDSWSMMMCHRLLLHQKELTVELKPGERQTLCEQFFKELRLSPDWKRFLPLDIYSDYYWKQGNNFFLFLTDQKEKEKEKGRDNGQEEEKKGECVKEIVDIQLSMHPLRRRIILFSDRKRFPAHLSPEETDGANQLFSPARSAQLVICSVWSKMPSVSSSSSSSLFN